MKKWQHAVALTAVFSVGVLLGVLLLPPILPARAYSARPQPERNGRAEQNGSSESTDNERDKSLIGTKAPWVEKLRSLQEETAQKYADDAERDPQFRSWLLSQDPDKLYLNATMPDDERRVLQDMVRRAQQIVREKK